MKPLGSALIWLQRAQGGDTFAARALLDLLALKLIDGTITEEERIFLGRALSRISGAADVVDAAKEYLLFPKGRKKRTEADDLAIERAIAVHKLLGEGVRPIDEASARAAEADGKKDSGSDYAKAYRKHGKAIDELTRLGRDLAPLYFRR